MAQDSDPTGVAETRMQILSLKGSVLEARSVRWRWEGAAIDGKNCIDPCVRLITGLNLVVAVGTVNSPHRRKVEKARVAEA